YPSVPCAPGANPSAPSSITYDTLIRYQYQCYAAKGAIKLLPSRDQAEPGTEAPTGQSDSLRRKGKTGRSGSEAFVAVVQSTDFRKRNHLPSLRWAYRASVRAILLQRKMGSRPLVIV